MIVPVHVTHAESVNEEVDVYGKAEKDLTEMKNDIARLKEVPCLFANYSPTDISLAALQSF